MSGYRLLINGKLINGASRANVYNPATGQVIDVAPIASEAQLDEAIASAARAFTAWAATPLETRAGKLNQIADAVDANAAELTRLINQEAGHPLLFAGYEISGLSAIFRYFATLSLPDRTVEDNSTRRARLVRRPLGVVAAILPWNFPFGQLGAKVAPALLAGNTLVVKPAGTTPLATLRLGELISSILPAGVINVISDDNNLGEKLATHPLVRKVSFTGSTAVGKKIMAGAAGSLKRITLELGGNDAAIVLDDADPKAIAQSLYMSAFYYSGQICCGIKRLYVHDSLYEDVVEELVSLARNAVAGDAADEALPFAPLQNRAQYERVLGYLSDAHANGVVVAGGAPLDRPGYFVPPTIVRDIKEGARLVDEEQFGPILPILRYTDVADAVRRANATPYGLGGSVWSSNIDRAAGIAAQLEVGTAWVNKHADTAPSIAFCGAKASGYGVEMAEEGLAEFTQVQVINEPPRGAG